MRSRCAVSAHVWNEIEHDLQYKPLTGELSEAEHRTLNAQGDLTRAGDTIAVSLLAATDERLANSQGAFRDQWDFVARARRYFRRQPISVRTQAVFQKSYSLHAREDRAGSCPRRWRGASQRASRAFRIAHRRRRWSASNVRVLISCSCFFSAARRDGSCAPSCRSGRGRPPRIASIARRFAEMPRRAKSGYSTSQRRSSPLPRPADRRFLGTRRLTVFGLPAPYRLSPGSFDRPDTQFPDA